MVVFVVGGVVVMTVVACVVAVVVGVIVVVFVWTGSQSALRVTGFSAVNVSGFWSEVMSPVQPLNTYPCGAVAFRVTLAPSL